MPFDQLKRRDFFTLLGGAARSPARRALSSPRVPKSPHHRGRIKPDDVRQRDQPNDIDPPLAPFDVRDP